MATANKLRDMHREFLVRCLACYDSPKDAVAALRARFGVDVTPQAAEHYDPTKSMGRTIAKRWRDLFYECREAFLKDLDASVPLANKTVRLKALSEAAAHHKAMGNYVAFAGVLEQIAKEVGGSYTNRRELTGRNGGAIRHEVAYEELTDEELDAELRAEGLDPDELPLPGGGSRTVN